MYNTRYHHAAMAMTFRPDLSQITLAIYTSHNLNASLCVYSHETEEEAVDHEQEHKPEHASIEEVTPRCPKHTKGQVLLHDHQDHGNNVQHHTLCGTTASMMFIFDIHVCV